MPQRERRGLGLCSTTHQVFCHIGRAVQTNFLESSIGPQVRCVLHFSSVALSSFFPAPLRHLVEPRKRQQAKAEDNDEEEGLIPFSLSFLSLFRSVVPPCFHPVRRSFAYPPFTREKKTDLPREEENTRRTWNSKDDLLEMGQHAEASRSAPPHRVLLKCSAASSFSPVPAPLPLQLDSRWPQTVV